MNLRQLAPFLEVRHSHCSIFVPPNINSSPHQPSFAALSGFCVHKSNLLKARMIVTTYKQQVRLLSSEPFGWFAPPKSTRAWEPTLLWNHCTH
jgi:hypothetical protein